MDTKTLSDFVTLAECKSFSKAAALKNITQPAFSRRIQALEVAVGTELIDRKSKNFKLTAAGKRFLIHARNLSSLVSSAVSDAQGVMMHVTEPVYIASPSFLSKTFFPGWYKTMQKAVSGLSLRISHQNGSNVLDELHKGIADFALVLHSKKIEAGYSLEGLQSRVIGRDKIIPVRAAQLKDNAQFLVHERGSYMNACADYVLGKQICSRKVAFESASTGLLREMALAGFGTAVLQESMVEDDLVQGYLKTVPGFQSLSCDILLVRAPLLSNKKAEALWAAAIKKTLMPKHQGFLRTSKR